jgi:hypothetical protein
MCIIPAAILSASFAVPVVGQYTPSAARPSIADMLSDFVTLSQSGRIRGDATGPHRFIDPLTFYPERWPAAAVDSLLNGLELIAVTGPSQTARKLRRSVDRPSW